MSRFILPQNDVDKKQIAYLSKQYDISPVLARILIDRGVDDLEEFFSPGTLHDPFLLQDMESAVTCIKGHIQEGDKICIYGDYDADGVCSSSILYLYLQELGANVQVYLPSREKDGYGLNKAAIEKIADDDVKLLITVDCGISNHEEVTFAAGKAMDVIISDHHQCPAVLPKCTAVINPLLGTYPFRLLCGAGVALKIVQALGGTDAMEKYIDLAAVATVSDLVPLIGENRAIVKRGLVSINGENKRNGILALFDVCGYKEGKLTSGQIAFGLGPRLNAAGRMDSAMKAFNLLIASEYEAAMECAKELNEYNNNRKQEENAILAEAEDQLKNHPTGQKIVMLKGEGWNKGVIGIVASKLVEKYNRPMFVFSQDGDMLTGSARSISGIHMFNLINGFSSLLIKFGGHEMAAGMSITADKFNEFVYEVNRYVDSNFPNDIFLPTVRCDGEITLAEVTHKMAEDLDKLSPMGMGNKTPVFCIRNVMLKGARLMGSDLSHVKMQAVQGNQAVDAVGFSFGERFHEMHEEYKYDVAVNISENSWNGTTRMQLQMKDMKPNIKSSGGGLVAASGAEYFNNLLEASRMEIIKVDQKRIRKMWNWEIYLNRRLRKDALGTAIYTSIPTCSYELFAYLDKEGLGDYVEIYTGEPKGNSCVVVAPDWETVELKYDRLIIFDYVPTGFVEKILEKNPGIQVVICYNDSTENALQKFLLGLDFERSTAKVYYSIINKISNLGVSRVEAVREFCKLGNETPFNAYFALEVFMELGFISIEDESIVINKQTEKKDLLTSEIRNSILLLRDKIGEEINIIKPERGTKVTHE